MLLRRGFDSVAFCLSQFSSNIDHALQGARELGKPPTLTEILQSKNSEEETDTKKVVQSGEPEEGVEEEKKGVKRKVGLHDSLSDEDGCLSAKEDGDNQVKGS
ncbi:hypothetical protein Dimus_015835 [Dionaea muscipula]